MPTKSKMKHSITEIIVSWRNNTPLGDETSEFYTDGSFLTSLNTVIGITLNNSKILFKYRKNYSLNEKTDTHVVWAEQYADEVVMPCFEEYYWDALTSS